VTPTWHLNIYGDVSKQIYTRTSSVVTNEVSSQGPSEQTGRVRKISHPQPKPQKKYDKEQLRFQYNVQLFTGDTTQANQVTVNSFVSKDVSSSSKSKPSKATTQKGETERQQDEKIFPRNSLRRYFKRNSKHPSKEATGKDSYEHQCMAGVTSTEPTQVPTKRNSPKKGKDKLQLPANNARLRLSSSEDYLPALKSPELKRTPKLLGAEGALFFANKSVSCENISEYKPTTPSKAIASPQYGSSTSDKQKQPVYFTSQSNHAEIPMMDFLKLPRRESQESNDEVFLPNTVVLDENASARSRRNRLENQIRKHSFTDIEIKMLMMDIVEPLDLTQVMLQNK